MIVTTSSGCSRRAGGTALIECGGLPVAAVWASVSAADGPLPALARELAEQVAADRLGLSRAAVRVASQQPSGRPLIMVDGRPIRAAVSLAHVEGLVAAAVAEDGGVGIDLVDPAEAGRGLDWWFTPDELALEPDEGLLRARLWAAKEAAYKAAALDEELRPRTITIESLRPGAFTWTARGRFASAAGSGRFLAAGRHGVAVAAARSRLAAGWQPARPASIPQPFTPEIASA